MIARLKRYQIFNEIFDYQISDWTIDFDISDADSSSEAYNSLKEYCNNNNPKKDHNKEKAEFCLLFVVDSILKWESVPRESVLDMLVKALQTIAKGLDSDTQQN